MPLRMFTIVRCGDEDLDKYNIGFSYPHHISQCILFYRIKISHPTFGPYVHHTISLFIPDTGLQKTFHAANLT